jgi:hypothetical protein
VRAGVRSELGSVLIMEFLQQPQQPQQTPQQTFVYRCHKPLRSVSSAIRNSFLHCRGLLAGRAGYREWCVMRNSLESLRGPPRGGAVERAGQIESTVVLTAPIDTASDDGRDAAGRPPPPRARAAAHRALPGNCRASKLRPPCSYGLAVRAQRRPHACTHTHDTCYSTVYCSRIPVFDYRQIGR